MARPRHPGPEELHAAVELPDGHELRLSDRLRQLGLYSLCDPTTREGARVATHAPRKLPSAVCAPARATCTSALIATAQFGCVPGARMDRALTCGAVEHAASCRSASGRRRDTRTYRACCASRGYCRDTVRRAAEWKARCASVIATSSSPACARRRGTGAQRARHLRTGPRRLTGLRRADA